MKVAVRRLNINPTFPIADGAKKHCGGKNAMKFVVLILPRINHRRRGHKNEANDERNGGKKPRKSLLERGARIGECARDEEHQAAQVCEHNNAAAEENAAWHVE